MKIHLDSFSGAAADLKKDNRTIENLVECLKREPLISCFDMSEHAWLRSLIAEAKTKKLILDDTKSVSYPWCKYTVV